MGKQQEGLKRQRQKEHMKSPYIGLILPLPALTHPDSHASSRGDLEEGHRLLCLLHLPPELQMSAEVSLVALFAYRSRVGGIANEQGLKCQHCYTMLDLRLCLARGIGDSWCLSRL